MRIPLLLLSAAMLSLAYLGQSGAKALFAAHDKALKDAKTLTIEFTVQQLPGSPVPYKLVLARPTGMRLEGPAGVTVWDGATKWEYRKSDNTFTEVKAGMEDATARLMADDLW